MSGIPLNYINKSCEKCKHYNSEYWMLGDTKYYCDKYMNDFEIDIRSFNLATVKCKDKIKAYYDADKIELVYVDNEEIVGGD